MLTYFDKIARILGTTDLKEIETECFKRWQNTPLNGVDLGLKSIETVASLIFAFPTQTLVSPILVRELKKLDFNPDISNEKPEMFFLSFDSEDVVVLTHENRLNLFRLMIDNGEMQPPLFWVEELLTVHPGIVKKLGTIDELLIKKIIYYIKNLGQPDLRKPTPVTTKKPKKLRRILKSEEPLFPYEALTLGFAKERREGKKIWSTKAHLRLQPYGPRSNPYYKPILIEEHIKRRKR